LSRYSFSQIEEQLIEKVPDDMGYIYECRLKIADGKTVTFGSFSLLKSAEIRLLDLKKLIALRSES
jgi:hypothetical protein